MDELLRIAAALAGAAGLLIIFLDFISTTIGASSFSIFSHRIAAAAFRLLRRILPDRNVTRWMIGPLILSAVAAWWILGVSVSWTLIFQGSAVSVVSSAGGQAGGWWMDYGYVGQVLSTLGGSLGKPGGELWAVVAVAVAVNGMVILTLSVSFVLNNTQAVSAGRAFLASAEVYKARGEPFHPALLSDLAGLVSNLNSVPFALYYSSHLEDRRLPDGLIRLAEAAGEGPHTRTLQTILRDLPYFHHGAEADADTYLHHLRRWAERFDFGDRG